MASRGERKSSSQQAEARRERGTALSRRRSRRPHLTPLPPPLSTCSLWMFNVLPPLDERMELGLITFCAGYVAVRQAGPMFRSWKRTRVAAKVKYVAISGAISRLISR